MRRRDFLKNTALTTLAFSIYPNIASAQDTISRDILIGKGSPKLTEGSGYRLHPEAAEAFEKLKAAAKKENILTEVVSSYRDFAHQNRIWERKFKNYTSGGLSKTEAIEKIIEYSTIPGTSRHHWGTDLDLIQGGVPTSGDVLVPSKFHGNGPFCKMKEWMNRNAESFGFYEVYTDNYWREGFSYEPWHFSYAPVSKPFLEAYKNLDISSILKQEQIMGSEAFSSDFIERYVRENILHINPVLLP